MLDSLLMADSEVLAGNTARTSVLSPGLVTVLGNGEGGSWQHRGSTNSIITTEASANPHQGLPSKPRELLPDLPSCSHTYQQENKDAY